MPELTFDNDLSEAFIKFKLFDDLLTLQVTIGEADGRHVSMPIMGDEVVELRNMLAVDSDIACYELRYYDGEYMWTLKRSRTKEPLLDLIKRTNEHNASFKSGFNGGSLHAWDVLHPLAPWRERLVGDDSFYEFPWSHNEHHPNRHVCEAKDFQNAISIYECKFGDFHNIEDYDEEIKV